MSKRMKRKGNAFSPFPLSFGKNSTADFDGGAISSNGGAAQYQRLGRPAKMTGTPRISEAFVRLQKAKNRRFPKILSKIEAGGSRIRPCPVPKRQCLY